MIFVYFLYEPFKGIDSHIDITVGIENNDIFKLSVYSLKRHLIEQNPKSFREMDAADLNFYLDDELMEDEDLVYNLIEFSNKPKRIKVSPTIEYFGMIYASPDETQILNEIVEKLRENTPTNREISRKIEELKEHSEEIIKRLKVLEKKIENIIFLANIILFLTTIILFFVIKITSWKMQNMIKPDFTI